MMKKILYVAGLAIVVFSACSKSPVEEMIPPATADFSRSFFFPRTSVSENVVTNQISTITLSSAYNTARSLVIGLEVVLPSGNEYLEITIKSDKIKPGLLGDYIISPFLTQGRPAGDVEVTYGYSKVPPATLFFLPGIADGVLHITGYNEKNNLIKGSYSFRINSDKDPRTATTTVWENTQIDVNGSFDNLQIRP